MNQWVMIELNYKRTPKTTKYLGTMNVTQVAMEKDVYSQETNLSSVSWKDEVDLETMIEEVHHALQVYPEAKVTMLQGLTREGMFKLRNREAYELNPEMVTLIRTDLAAAKKAFAPIERTVKVQMVAPSIELGPKGE